MTRRDEFDDPEGFQSAFGKIAEAMEQGHSGLRRRGPLLGILTASVALFILFAVFWSTYPRGEDAANGPVPTIRADATPYKATPDNPGGMDIPYRDSTVFEALRTKGDKEGGKIESLLPPAEQPIPKEQMFAGLKTDPIEDKAAAQQPPKVIEADDVVADKALDSGPVKSSATSEQQGTILPVKDSVKESPTVLGVAETVTKTEPAAGNAKAPTAVKTPEAGTYYIQLGSVKDRAAATVEWKKLQKQFPDQLGSLTLRVQEASLGAKGTFYRIQGGSVAQSAGKEICSAIASKRSGGCIVVAR
ncbi:MAG: sporulation related domain protein [Micavibrio sp.]|nr:sporulation related domain protein [Micavibrio sp.]